MDKLWLGALALMACAPEAPSEFATDGAVPPPRQTLTLEVGDLVLGEMATMTVTGADPGDTVEVIRASRLGFGPCPASFGGNCLDIAGLPIVLVGGAEADASGTATIELSLPDLPNLAGAHFFQAVTRSAAAPSSGEGNESLPVLRFAEIPECMPDAFEPNDDQASASDFVGQSLDGVMCEDDGVDWYTLEVGPNEILEAGAFYDTSDGVVSLTVIDAAGDPIGMSDNGDGTESFAWRNRDSVAVDVSLRVDAVSDNRLPGVPYELDARLEDPEPCIDDVVEPNNDEANALPSVFGQNAQLVSCDNDPDVFEITTTAPGVIDVDLTFQRADGTIFAQLFDDMGNELVNEQPSGGSASFEYGALPGTYYLWVNPLLDDTYGGGVPYNLEVNVGPPTSCFDDSFEPNNASADAVTLTPGTYQLLGACTADTYDWYVVDVMANETLTVTLDFTNSNGNINLALYQVPPATGLSGATAISSTAGNQEQVSFQSAVDAQLWFAVYINSDQGGIVGGNFYDMTVDVN
jgi:hypothetical protein